MEKIRKMVAVLVCNVLYVNNNFVYQRKHTFNQFVDSYFTSNNIFHYIQLYYNKIIFGYRLL